MEVVYQHLSKPKEIKAEKQRFPVAYLGVGILEWHGEHNAAGLDGVKANALCEHFASVFGGVVFPPLYYGENREEICEIVFKSETLDAATFDHTKDICEKIGYDFNALEENAKRSIANNGYALWQNLMEHIFFEMQSFGYTHIIVIPGHYPLFPQMELAIRKYKKNNGKCKVFSLQDDMYADDRTSGDHAAKFETSLMMALMPKTVDLSRLNSDVHIGVLGEDPKTKASAKFGFEIISKFECILKDYFTAEKLL